MNYSGTRNFAVFILGVISPEIFTYYYNHKINNDSQFAVQYITGSIILLSSLYVIVSSLKGYKNSQKNEKSFRVIFVALSFLAFVYISFALYMQFALRNISIG
jgi:uncharacterized membrane protein YoaK (UPF0700 family)